MAREAHSRRCATTLVSSRGPRAMGDFFLPETKRFRASAADISPFSPIPLNGDGPWPRQSWTAWADRSRRRASDAPKAKRFLRLSRAPLGERGEVMTAATTVAGAAKRCSRVSSRPSQSPSYGCVSPLRRHGRSCGAASSRASARPHGAPCRCVAAVVCAAARHVHLVRSVEAITLDAAENARHDLLLGSHDRTSRSQK